jgi:hypothetical protein
MPSPQTLTKRCPTCIFSRNSPIKKERFKQHINEALTTDAPAICHHTKDTVCRGFDDAYPDATNFQRVMKRLNCWHEVELEKVEVLK